MICLIKYQLATSYREFKTCLQLHSVWLPVSSRINFKILLLTFKAIHGLAPSYINDLVKLEIVSGLTAEYCCHKQILKLQLPWATVILLPRHLNLGTVCLLKLEWLHLLTTLKNV